MIRVCVLFIAILAPAELASSTAWAAARTPSMALSDPSHPVEIPRQRVNPESLKPSASFFAQIKQRFSKFRPSWNRGPLPFDGNEEALQSTTLIESIYDSDFSRRMRDRYRDTVRNYERRAEDLTWQPTRAENQRYIDSRRDMAKWALKEIGRDQLQDLKERYRSGDGLLNVVQETRGDHFQRQEAEIERQRHGDSKISESERIARVHRRDDLAEDEQDEIPTKLRTRMNPLKGRGALSVQSALLNATVEGGAKGGDKLAVEVARDFRKLELRSRARYNVDKSYLTVNVLKQITKEIALDLSAERWTGDQAGDAGQRSNDTAKVIYNVSF